MSHVTHHETTRNGVRVKVVRFWDARGESLGSTVEADCLCLGMPFRVHTTENCPALVQSSILK